MKLKRIYIYIYIYIYIKKKIELLNGEIKKNIYVQLKKNKKKTS